MTADTPTRAASTDSSDPSIRERLEAREEATLAVGGTRSREATRQRVEDESPVRTAFQRDRDRITHASSFRRLMHKTQVFIAPSGDHYRTRLTHTLEVTQIARTIGRALGLNEDLIEAIGLSHDLGHTPFGHAGERALAEVFPGFRHNEQSLRVVDVLEKDGQGLNLTDMVRDGILRHSKGRSSITGRRAGRAATPEGDVVRLSDAIAYINHDLDDAIRAGMIRWADVPPVVGQVLGEGHAARINTLVGNVVQHSAVEDVPAKIVLTDGVREAADVLRDFLYEQVYTPINQRRDTARAQQIVRDLFHRYCERPELMVDAGLVSPADDPLERRVADHVAALTDRSALAAWERHVLNG
ncbi:MAG TPA: deoxyguanosinetriphosphate triphosphohydrolase [Thermomicrobiales bacterium]|jgi:dGTPase|nr:deoxyguanosinetriphosphate triphosphohydrolase [Thermomicrobiales bacterium]